MRRKVVSKRKCHKSLTAVEIWTVGSWLAAVTALPPANLFTAKT